MYTKDKSNRVTLRLNEQQFEFVRMQAEIMGVSPSEFLRVVINTVMCSFNGTAKQKLNKYMEGSGRENDKANKHDFL